MAILGISLGAGLLTVGHDLTFITAFPSHAFAVQLFWGLTLASAGILQLSVLTLSSHRLLHRWAGAFAGFVVGAAFWLTLWADIIVPAYLAPVTCYVLAEGYIFVMLKGARWNG